MLEYMTNSQIAALIVGIVFSVISIATTLLAIKYAKKINSFAKVVSLALVAPFIAFAGWLFLIFSFLDGFRKDELLNLIISIILALILVGMIIIVAKALYTKHKDEYEDETDAEVEENEDNIIEAQEENEQTPLLVENTQQEELENKAEEEKEEELEGEETSEENVSAASLENEEEKEEEQTGEEEQQESEETSEEVNNEETQEEVNENEEASESEEKEEAEEVEENKEETEENKDIDKEFDEFLETLRKKVEENQNKPTDDNNQ